MTVHLFPSSDRRIDYRLEWDDEAGTIAMPGFAATEDELRAWAEEATNHAPLDVFSGDDIFMAVRRFLDGPAHTIVHHGWYLKLVDVHHDASDFLALFWPFRSEIPAELPESLRGVEPTPHRVTRLPAGAIA